MLSSNQTQGSDFFYGCRLYEAVSRCSLHRWWFCCEARRIPTHSPCRLHTLNHYTTAQLASRCISKGFFSCSTISARGVVVFSLRICLQVRLERSRRMGGNYHWSIYHSEHFLSKLLCRTAKRNNVVLCVCFVLYGTDTLMSIAKFLDDKRPNYVLVLCHDATARSVPCSYFALPTGYFANPFWETCLKLDCSY